MVLSLKVSKFWEILFVIAGVKKNKNKITIQQENEGMVKVLG